MARIGERRRQLGARIFGMHFAGHAQRHAGFVLAPMAFAVGGIGTRLGRCVLALVDLKPPAVHLHARRARHLLDGTCTPRR
ncbi:MAG: hypothetical protein DCC68_09555 [Planctomycetota bacterium]|nr:MAG: hypothetical protein DCC68_09555 [Planctomycetota bacterium]